MKITFISLHPEFTRAYTGFGPFKRADQLSVHHVQLRDFSADRHGSIDARPYGGGDGMVMRVDCLAAALASVRTPASRVLMPSPRGRVWDKEDAESYASCDDLIFVCPRFGGVDQRFIDHYVDHCFSMGRFIVSGGELPALMAADSIVRQLPGALGNHESVEYESFGEVFSGALEEDLYTRPEEFNGHKVPGVLLSGDHRKIEEWKQDNRRKESR